MKKILLILACCWAAATQATEQIGESEILRISGFLPAQFNKMSAQEHFSKSMDLVRQLRTLYEKEIQEAQ